MEFGVLFGLCFLLASDERGEGFVVIALYSRSRRVHATYAKLGLPSRLRIILRCIQKWNSLRYRIFYCIVVSVYISGGWETEYFKSKKQMK